MLSSPSKSKPQTSFSSSRFDAAPPSRRGERHEQVEFASGELHLVARSGTRPTRRVDAQVAHRQHAVRCAETTTDQGAKARHEHDEAERLPQEVVGPEVEPLGLVVLALLRRQHEHRAWRPLSPGARGTPRSRSCRGAGCRARSPRTPTRWPSTVRRARCGRGRRRTPRRAGRERSSRPSRSRRPPPARARAQCARGDGARTIATGSRSQPLLRRAQQPFRGVTPHSPGDAGDACRPDRGVCRCERTDDAGR